MRILIFLLILCLTSTMLLRAQEENKPLPLYVIAPNGLKLREGPGTQYKVLETAPYKSKVMLTDINFIQYDTSQKIPFPKYFFYEENYTLTGAWLKIRYKNKDGYMLSTWLYPTCEFSEPNPSGINTHFQMFDAINHFDCFKVPNPELGYWYDLSRNPQGQLLMEKTKVEFLVEVGEIGYGVIFGLITKRRDNKKANRIIYSVKPLAEGLLMQLPVPALDTLYQKVQKESLYYNGDYEIQAKLLFKAKNEELKKVHLQMSHDAEKHETNIFFTIQGKKKLMYTQKYSDGFGVSNVQLVADIDGDGVLDYILGFGDEKSSVAILFLSAEAEPGFSHKAVATIGNGYIC